MKNLLPRNKRTIIDAIATGVCAFGVGLIVFGAMGDYTMPRRLIISGGGVFILAVYVCLKIREGLNGQDR